MIASLKNAKALLLLGLILLVLGGSAGVLVLDEKLERGDSVGFLRFEEGIERQLVEDTTHNRAHAIATAYALVATGTATALQHPFPQNGTLVLNDPLSSDSTTFPWKPGYRATGTNCSFTNGVFHVVEPNSNRFYYCVANNTNFSNFIFQVQMTILRGNAGGIIFRDIGPENNYFRLYYFSIGRNGTYNLQRFVHDPAHSSNQLVSGQSTFIKTGSGQTNLITVVARGNNIDLYVNQRYMVSLTDSTYTQGEIGLAAEDQGDPTEVAFSNAQVYALS
jgi:eukaryotic-like serine/threonine-protein kinase